MRKLIIDRNIWLRGEAIESYLLRQSDQKQCCVGIYLEQCGIERTKLSGVMSAQGLAMKEPLPQEAQWLLGVANRDAQWLYRVNDNPESPASLRESEITKVFAQHKVEVEFIN